MTTGACKTRFAPSPTGLLHLGNVRTALFNWLLARHQGGRLLLRLEDTDAARGQEKYAGALVRDLRWLGLQWDEGHAVGGADGPYAQSARGPIYADYMTRLTAQARAYPCFCTEHELAVARKTALAAGRPPRYSGRCRNLSAADVEARRAQGIPATLRFHVADGETVSFDDGVRGPQTFNTSDIGDFVIRRSDGTPAFFFCNAVDDALMGVTLVVRGDDHLTNTPRQILLLQALGLRVPQYAHIALVVGTDGAPLSKRTGSRSVEDLRNAGYLPLAINNYLARLGHTYAESGWLDIDGLISGFSIARLHRAPARFDEQQLMYWQHEALRHALEETLWDWLGEHVATLVPNAQRADFLAAVRGNIAFPRDAEHWAKVLFTDSFAPTHVANEAIRKAGSRFFEQARTLFAAPSGDFAAVTQALAQATGCRGKALYQPLRAALTGELDGPELARLLPLLGPARTSARLAQAAERAA